MRKPRHIYTHRPAGDELHELARTINRQIDEAWAAYQEGLARYKEAKAALPVLKRAVELSIFEKRGL